MEHETRPAPTSNATDAVRSQHLLDFESAAPPGDAGNAGEEDIVRSRANTGASQISDVGSDAPLLDIDGDDGESGRNLDAMVEAGAAPTKAATNAAAEADWAKFGSITSSAAGFSSQGQAPALATSSSSSSSAAAAAAATASPTPASSSWSLSSWSLSSFAARWQAVRTFLSDHRNLKHIPSLTWQYLHPKEAEPVQELRPLLPSVGLFLSRLLPVRNRHGPWWILVTVLYLMVWMVGFVVLVVKSGYSANTDLGTPTFVSCSASMWSLLDRCGPQGVYCTPFNGTQLVFKCPANCASVYTTFPIVSQTRVIIGTGYVIGDGVYRADSWICQAAILEGIITNENGGCGALRMTGSFTNFTAASLNGISSYSFDSWFPKSFSFVQGVGVSGCQEQPTGILIYNVIFLAVFVYLFRLPKLMLWWTLVVVGFWHVILASEPIRTDAYVSYAFSSFLCGIAVCYAFYRIAARHALPDNSSRYAIEMSIMMALFWVGVMWPLATDWLQFESITVKFITSSPKNLFVFMVGFAIIVILFVIQSGKMRRRRELVWFVLAYAIFFAIFVALAVIDRYLYIHLHHYIVAMLLIPAVRYENRLSIACLGILLGLFLEGIARWGFDSPLETLSEIRGGGLYGSAIPGWTVDPDTWNPLNNTVLSWSPIDATATLNNFDGFSVLMNDAFEIYRGPSAQLNISEYLLQDFIPYYFRVSYTRFGSSFDYNVPLTVYKNGTVIQQPYYYA